MYLKNHSIDLNDFRQSTNGPLLTVPRRTYLPEEVVTGLEKHKASMHQVMTPMQSYSEQKVMCEGRGGGVIDVVQ